MKNKKIAITAIVVTAILTFSMTSVAFGTGIMMPLSGWCEPVTELGYQVVDAWFYVCDNIDPRITALESITVVNGTDGVDGKPGYDLFGKGIISILIQKSNPTPHSQGFALLEYNAFPLEVDVSYAIGSERVYYTNGTVGDYISTTEYVLPDDVSFTIDIDYQDQNGQHTILDSCTVNSGESVSICDVKNIILPPMGKLSSIVYYTPLDESNEIIQILISMGSIAQADLVTTP